MAAISVPVCAFFGAMFTMGTDSCSSSQSSGALKCTSVGEAAIVVLPVGLAIVAVVLGSVAVQRQAKGSLLTSLSWWLPVLGLLGSCAIAAQDAQTPPPRWIVWRAEREMAGRPHFTEQDQRYQAMLAEVRAAIVAQVPGIGWGRSGLSPTGCSTGPPPLDTVDKALSADYLLGGDRAIPDAAWPAVRAAVLQIGARYGFTKITNDFGRPGVHDLTLRGPYDAVLDVGHREGTVISLEGGTFVADVDRPCG